MANWGYDISKMIVESILGAFSFVSAVMWIDWAKEYIKQSVATYDKKRERERKSKLTGTKYLFWIAVAVMLALIFITVLFQSLLTGIKPSDEEIDSETDPYTLLR
jgi:ABC-type Fe3+ transport system permease subunit